MTTTAAPFAYRDPLEHDMQYPYREYDGAPPYESPSLLRLWFVETLVDLWVTSSDRKAFDALAVYRRDLAPGDLLFMLTELCEISVAVAHERDDNCRPEPFGALRNDYVSLLDRISKRPGGAM